MGNVNNRNYQLSLAFKDDDLKRPKHDEIMHWLGEWVKDVDNIRRFFGNWPERSIGERDVLSETALDNIKETENLESIQRNFNARFNRHLREEEVNEIFPNEPDRPIKFVGYSWEPMLHQADKGTGYYRPQMIGFCDMVATYEVGVHLCLLKHKLKGVERTDSISSWDYFDVGEEQTFQQYKERQSIYFEVKTEIRSVGELMRQLQLYRSSKEVRTARQLVVVGPPHNEAAKVVRDHGFGYVDFHDTVG